MALYSLGNNVSWNAMLNKNYRDRNINALAIVRYQIQAGMDDLAKKKLNSEEIIIWYLRLMKSIEKTARAIIRVKHPLPGDQPLFSKQFPEHLAIKRKRDQELSAFFHTSSY